MCTTCMYWIRGALPLIVVLVVVAKIVAVAVAQTLDVGDADVKTDKFCPVFTFLCGLWLVQLP